MKTLISQQEKEIENLRNQLLERVRNGNLLHDIFASISVILLDYFFS